ncbi:hypothetical protein AAE478_005074 [Parahypoxylon ruwenzoriense]
MDDQMTVSALADIIRQQAEILETSLPPHAYTDYHGDKSLSIARSKLLEACDKLNHLVTGPIECMPHSSLFSTALITHCTHN